MKDENVWLSCLGVITLVTVVPVFAYVIYGFVLVRLWAWFIVPFGLPVIDTYQAIGLAIVVGFLTTRSTSNSKDDRSTKDKGIAIVALMFSPFITLIVGWVVHSLMR